MAAGEEKRSRSQHESRVEGPFGSGERFLPAVEMTLKARKAIGRLEVNLDPGPFFDAQDSR